MIQNEEKYNKLYDAAETIYKYFEEGKGFHSGSRMNNEGRRVTQFNDFKGARNSLEYKLHRDLTDYETTVLALAVGYGPTRVLTDAERHQAFEVLWDNKPNVDRVCIPFNRLVTCI